MNTASVDQVRHYLRSLLARVAAGETVVITDCGEPVAELKPVASREKRLRPFGLCAGEFVVPEDFDAPLPADLLDSFEGK
jgi:antitoxin (DNA-binding transcriptional repressor) of toxin-antitoxin stability system